MTRDELLHQLNQVGQSVEGLFRLCPIDHLEFTPAKGMRSLLELGNHFAALPLVDLAILQGNPKQVTDTIEDALHGAGPEEWVEIFGRGIRAVAEYFEGLSGEEFEGRSTRAHYGTAHSQSVWLLELINHIYHHRGQLFVYLKILGIPVDVEHLYT
jgi:uncharacterized damage-inducible protein DinB